MYKLEKAANVKDCIAFNYRMAPAVLKAKKMIEEGLLGDVYHFK